MPPQNPFTAGGKPLRCVYDEESQKWWFSAVDICAIVTDSDYETARCYWKQQKAETFRRKTQLVGNSNQLKLPAANGKFYFTDVLDLREVLYFIQTIPSDKADPFRLWIADVLAADTNVEAMLVEAGAECAKQIEEFIRNSQPYVLQGITRKRVYTNEN